MDENAESPSMNMMSTTGVSDLSYQWVESNAEDDMSTVHDWITTRLGLMGYRYVSLHHSWAVYVVIV